MAASLASYRQLSRGGAPEWCQSGAWDPKLLIARGCAQLQSTLQSSSSGSSSSSQGGGALCARLEKGTKPATAPLEMAGAWVRAP